MVSRCTLFLILCLIFEDGQSAKILGIFPTPSISHQVVYRALMKTLAERSHDVVTITTDPADYNGTLPNLRQIDVHDDSYSEWVKCFNFVEFKEKNPSRLDLYRKYYICTLKIAEIQLLNAEAQKILNNPEEKFDMCIFESLVPLTFPIKDRFNCSLILMSSLSAPVHQFDSFGNPSNPVIYPDIMSPFFGDLDFWKRLDMFITDFLYRHMYYWEILPLFDENAKRIYGESTRPVIDIERDADMMFLNIQPLLGDIRPTVPAIIYMGSMHIQPVKPLPQDLKKILDRSKQGVIYLSLGSNVKSAQLSQPKINAFLEAFKAMPYSVLWKWENDTLPGKPDNVHISKWLPQQDLLAHPNLKVFITQGGLQSMEEAIHHKVPLIGMPFMADQDLNVRKFIKFGIGTNLDLYTLSKENVIEAVNKVINDPSYRNNISKLSDLLKDQPQTSMERAVWWTEYVIRHKGAQHLKSPATKIPLYQYFLIDVIAFILVCTLALLSVVIISFICIYKLMFKKEEKLKSS